MQIHASCAALDGYGVLLLGPPGCGKSDMVLRLIDKGFRLVADDRVEIDDDGWACAPHALEGLLEVRGLGIVRLPCVPRARLALAVDLATRPERLPYPQRHALLDLPVVGIDPAECSAAERIRLALDCATGRVLQAAGAFT